MTAIVQAVRTYQTKHSIMLQARWKRQRRSQFPRLRPYPQLGFIHEDASQSFVLDIADLFRDTVLIPAAFRAAREASKKRYANIERLTRLEVGGTLARQNTVPGMIQKIKDLFPEQEAD